MKNALYDFIHSLRSIRKLTRSFSDTLQLVNKNRTRAFSMGKSLYLGQFVVQNIETWQADSSTGKTPMATHSFSVPNHSISI